MAFAAVEVTFGYAGNSGPIQRAGSGTALFGSPKWSQSMASPGTTTNAAQAPSTGLSPCFHVRSNADVYIAIGSAPDASSGAANRIPVAANTDYDFFCTTGDKLAWVAA